MDDKPKFQVQEIAVLSKYEGDLAPENEVERITIKNGEVVAVEKIENGEVVETKTVKEVD